MSLGAGYSAEEQLTGEAEFGGLQIEVFPMRAAAFEKRFPAQRFTRFLADNLVTTRFLCCSDGEAGLGLAPGGRMRQEIYADPFSIHDWDTEHSSRCFVHLFNATAWQAITGERPPSKPRTVEQYTSAGLPWFDYYASDLKALDGSGKLANLKTVKETAESRRDEPLPNNESLSISNIVYLRAGLKPYQVRESEIWVKP